MKCIKLTVLSILALSIALSCNKRPRWVGAFKHAEGGGGNVASNGAQNPAAVETGDLASSEPGLDLVWKRYRAFENGLVTGLALKKDDFCLELGKQSCIDKTHLTFLGGNEPYESAQYERAQTPTVLTAVAVDRVVLSACTQRLELDRAAGASAVVFKHFPLSGGQPEPKQIEAQASELYRRILARDPEAAELSALQTLSVGGFPADKIGLILCYAIATSAENILL